MGVEDGGENGNEVISRAAARKGAMELIDFGPKEELEEKALTAQLTAEETAAVLMKNQLGTYSDEEELELFKQRLAEFDKPEVQQAYGRAIDKLTDLEMEEAKKLFE